MNEKIVKVPVRELKVWIPAKLFSKMERYGIMKGIDDLVADFLEEEIEKRMNGARMNDKRRD